MGDLPNNVRTHFITSEGKEKVLLIKLLLHDIRNRHIFKQIFDYAK
jgi:hypothetical protein